MKLSKKDRAYIDNYYNGVLKEELDEVITRLLANEIYRLGLPIPTRRQVIAYLKGRYFTAEIVRNAS